MILVLDSFFFYLKKTFLILNTHIQYFGIEKDCWCSFSKLNWLSKFCLKNLQRREIHYCFYASCLDVSPKIILTIFSSEHWKVFLCPSYLYYSVLNSLPYVCISFFSCDVQILKSKLQKRPSEDQIKWEYYIPQLGNTISSSESTFFYLQTLEERALVSHY